MDVLIRGDDDLTTVAVSGELDLSTAEKFFDAAMTGLDDPACRRLALDLSDLSFIDSSGVNTLIELRAATERARTALTIVRPSSRVAEVLNLTGVAHLFDIADA